MGLKVSFLGTSILVFLSLSCTTKKSKSDIEVNFTQDTLKVGYTYWWPESGPFIGQCGDELSFVCMGTIRELQNPTDDAGPLYTSQIGTIEIERVFKIKTLPENNYVNQKFISTDCFDGLELTVGDTVLVCCYDYEGGYTIPGNKSIIKITDFDDPVIHSLRKYIDSDQNALQLKNDIGLWAKKRLGRNLERIIKCAELIQSNISEQSLNNQ